MAQIIERTETGSSVLVDPALRNLLKRSRIQIVELLPATPERNNQVGFDQEIKVFADALAGHVEMATKFVQGLAVVMVKVIQQGAAAGIGQGSKNIVHLPTNMQPNGCILSPTQQAFPYRKSRRADGRQAKPGKPEKQLRLLQVERARPEVDDPVMSIQDLGPEEAHRRRRKLQRFMQNPAQINHSDIVPADVDYSDGHFPDPRHIQPLFFEIDRSRRQAGLFCRNMQPPDKRPMQDGGERASVYHQPRLRTIYQPVDVQIESFGHKHRYFLKSAKIETGHRGRHIRLQVQNEKLSLTIQDSSAGKQNVGPEDPVGLQLVHTALGTAGPAQVRRDRRHLSDS